MISPMLAKTASAPFDRAGWLFERKVDGVRCIADVNSDEVHLQSRTGNDITAQFPELANLNKRVRTDCILDGEIVCSTFNAIQHRIHRQNPFDIRIGAKQFPALYLVFDILAAGGKNLRNQVLTERKDALVRTVDKELVLPWVMDTGKELFCKVLAEHGEGIMAKGNSPYLEGVRSPTWLKVKNWQEAVFYIMGITRGENARADTFGALILGERLPSGKFVHVGNVGTGLDYDMLQKLLAVLNTLPGEPAFKVEEDVLQWARPEYRCEVRYYEKSTDGILRFPSFRKLIK